MPKAEHYPPGYDASPENRDAGCQPLEARSPRQHRVPLAPPSDRACLLACSRAPMVNLHDQLGSARISILLIDTNGQILDRVGDGSATPEASEHWPRANVGPSSQSRALSGHRSIDMARRESAAFGIATPINAASGGVIGILDRSGAGGLGMQHIGAMLELTAEAIERRVVDSDERGFLLLRFHTRVEMLEGPCNAIALFDRDSRLIAYNRLAANLLSLSRNGLNARCEDCLETQWPGLVGSAAFAKNSPIQLRAKNGTTVLAQARLR